jgi:hypothetical protein
VHDVPTKRTIRNRSRHKLSFWEELSLEYGNRSEGLGFASDAERREAWLRHRDELLAKCRAGRRPDAWWTYEAPFRRPEYEREPARLYEAGLLGEEEKRELVADWREAFERAQRPDAWICCGPGKFLKGGAARRMICWDAGVPHALVRQWTAEHRRRAKTIKKRVSPPGRKEEKRPSALKN